MNIAGPLEDARFVERPNRFLTVVDIGGEAVESHLPDPGRLRELLIPGADLKVRPSNGQSPNRRTRWTTVMVKSGRQWVSIDSTLPNRFVSNLLESGKLPTYKSFRLVKSEVTVGNHRFDFLLEKDGAPFYLEVKSVTFVENFVAQFPDAQVSCSSVNGPTQRYFAQCGGGIPSLRKLSWKRRPPGYGSMSSPLK